MWMSNILIVVDGTNVDHNSLNDIAAAVEHAGATVGGVDAQSGMIEATVPANELPTVAAMEGVAYVRCVFNYVCNNDSPQAA